MGKKNYKDDDEYRKRRERNNEAVKRSRVKSKMRSQANRDKVQQLQLENTQLEEKMKYLTSEVEYLKELLCNSQGNELADNARMQELLNEFNNGNNDQFLNPPTSSSQPATSAAGAGTRRSSRRSTDHKY